MSICIEQNSAYPTIYLYRGWYTHRSQYIFKIKFRLQWSHGKIPVFKKHMFRNSVVFFTYNSKGWEGLVLGSQQVVVNVWYGVMENIGNIKYNFGVMDFVILGIYIHIHTHTQVTLTNFKMPKGEVCVVWFEIW